MPHILARIPFLVILIGPLRCRVVSRGETRYNFAVPEQAIVVRSLEKTFPPSRSGWRTLLQPFEKASIPALCGVSLEASSGESVALLGANGAGKSTLLRILATLLLPTSGAASVAGHDVAREPRSVRRSLGFHAGSDLGFYARLTARENLVFFGRLNHLSSAEASARIFSISEQLALQEALDRQVRTLSVGTIQRLSLARALLHRPRVLLLDEPTRSLDAIAAAKFRDFLKNRVLKSGDTTLLFASHTLQEIEFLADRVAVFGRGRILACDSVSRLKQRANAASLERVFFHLTGHSPHSVEPPPV